MLLLTDGFKEQLTEDSSFLKADRRLDTELVDKLILQLNRIYPQILTDKEATKVRLDKISNTHLFCLFSFSFVLKILKLLEESMKISLP